MCAARSAVGRPAAMPRAHGRLRPHWLHATVGGTQQRLLRSRCGPAAATRAATVLRPHWMHCVPGRGDNTWGTAVRERCVRGRVAAPAARGAGVELARPQLLAQGLPVDTVGDRRQGAAARARASAGGVAGLAADTRCVAFPERRLTQLPAAHAHLEMCPTAGRRWPQPMQPRTRSECVGRTCKSTSAVPAASH